MTFATTDDLATRLGRSLTSTEDDQASAFLADATAYLQREVGQLVEAGTATFTAKPKQGTRWLDLPQQPVVAITSVTIDGVAFTDYELVDGRLLARCGWWDATGNRYATVVVAFSYGFATVPADLTAWACVLASQAMGMVSSAGSLGAVGVQSVSKKIDDWAKTVTYAQAQSAMSLPEPVLDGLRATYGAGAFVTDHQQ